MCFDTFRSPNPNTTQTGMTARDKELRGEKIVSAERVSRPVDSKADSKGSSLTKAVSAVLL